MKQTEVQIMGTSYMLTFPEENEPDNILSAASLVDSAMCKIRDNGKTKARERVAVLAALNIAADMLKKLNHSSETPTLTTLTTPPSEAVAQLIADIDQTLEKSTTALHQASQATAKA